MKAVLLISHGSRMAQTKVEIEALVRRLKETSVTKIFEFAFLELEFPSIPQGVEVCIQKGATEIVVLLNFLNSGRHVDEDIPAIIHKEAIKYPHIKFCLTKPIGQHPGIDALFLDLLNDGTK